MTLDKHTSRLQLLHHEGRLDSAEGVAKVWVSKGSPQLPIAPPAAAAPPPQPPPPCSCRDHLHRDHPWDLHVIPLASLLPLQPGFQAVACLGSPAPTGGGLLLRRCHRHRHCRGRRTVLHQCVGAQGQLARPYRAARILFGAVRCRAAGCLPLLLLFIYSLRSCRGDVSVWACLLQPPLPLPAALPRPLPLPGCCCSAICPASASSSLSAPTRWPTPPTSASPSTSACEFVHMPRMPGGVPPRIPSHLTLTHHLIHPPTPHAQAQGCI